ncbi:MAG TPA: IPT/TIG domain-containing protein [Thermoanaerobaculia bacterium]|jgi:phosphatidylserine/phosphatidylglycerophosphate/cardiolipin synthase-like enzyme|nr:IPT/TIG domain-containing protein [Thermoanaerobaculia bacterium]
MPATFTNIQPTSGSVKGGQTLTLTGTGFRADVEVRFVATDVDVEFVSATQLKVVTPLAAYARSITVTVQNPGEPAVTRQFHFTPVIDSVMPEACALGAAPAVIIRGEGFDAGHTITIGGAAVAAVNVVSRQEVRCNGPILNAAVLADVTIRIAGGSGAGTRKRRSIAYSAPQVTAVEPKLLPLTGGNLVIRGRFFTGVNSVDVDVTNVIPVVNSDTQLTLVAPAHAAGVVDVTVTNAGVPVTLTSALRYEGAKIAEINPKRGPANQATAVVIRGERFANAGVAVTIGAAAVVNASNGTTINATTAAQGPGVADVVVQVGAEPAVTLPNGYTFVEAATVTAVDPPVGITAGGHPVTVSGTGFEPDVAVTIGGNPAVVAWVSPTTLTVVPAGHAAGAVNVVARNPQGAAGTLVNGFTYTDVTSVEPKRGPTGALTNVVILGARFQGMPAVTFGGVPATNVVVANAGRITATAPLHARGTVDVAVGTSVLRNAFTYSTVTKLDPDEGPLAGLAVTIDGEGFGEGMAVDFGGTPGLMPNVVSATQLTVTAPAVLAAGAVDVTVVRETRFANAFTYFDLAQPSVGDAAITAILPARGRTVGGTRVAIRGRGFPDDAAVNFGITAAPVVSRSPIEIVVTAPPGAAAAVDVEVRGTVAGAEGEGRVPQVLTSAGGFTYQAAMDVDPAAGPLAGNSVLVIAGGGFGDGVAVTIGGLPGTALTIDSAQALRITTPLAAAAAAVDVVVRRTGTAAAGFTYYDVAQVTAIDPIDGRTTGGRTVTISGTGFAKNPRIDIGGTQATLINRLSATTLTARTPIHVVGPAHVDVTNPHAAAGQLANDFTYRLPPAVTAVVPPNGPVEGGRWITVTGTDFIRGAAVLVDNVAVAAADTVFTNGTTISVRVPPHTAAAVDVAVRNPNEPASAPLPGGFTYVATPAETGNNQAHFLMDGAAYFTELQTLMNDVRSAPPHPLTYVRLAFWMVEKDVWLGGAACQGFPAHLLRTYIDQVIRAGHDVDIILWDPGQAERQVSEAAGVRPLNIAFGEAVAALDQAVVGLAGAGRARVFHERYEGPLGSSLHQKIAIFSIAGQRTAVIGGINLASNYFSDAAHANGTWHDAAVRLVGPATDDVEAEWVRRWKKADVTARQWMWDAIGAAGTVRARNFAWSSAVTVRQTAVTIRENTTKQNNHVDNRTVTIATTRAVGETRYTHILDLLLAKINAANTFIYMENYHFGDPQIVRAIYTRHETRRLAGVDMPVVIIVPRQGGGSGYLNRRSWLQLALRLRTLAGAQKVTRVHYDLGAGAGPQSVDPALCNAWTVDDAFVTDPDTVWFEEDSLTFQLILGGGPVVVPFGSILSVEANFHLYACLSKARQDFIYTHGKIAIIDDTLVVGSANWSYRSMQYDAEISAFIDSPAVAAAALGLLLGHYDLVTPLNVNNIEAEAMTNLLAVDDNTHLRHGALQNSIFILPLSPHGGPGVLTMPSAVPGVAEAGLDYTWI